MGGYHIGHHRSISSLYKVLLNIANYVGKLQPTGCILVNKGLLAHSHVHVCIVYGYFHVIAAELLQTTWPSMSKIFITWPFKKKFAQPRSGP